MRALFTTARSAWSRRAAATCNEVPRTREYRTHLINNVRKLGRTPPLLPDVRGDRARLPDIIIDDRRLNDDLDVFMLPISGAIFSAARGSSLRKGTSLRLRVFTMVALETKLCCRLTEIFESRLEEKSLLG